MTSKYKAALWSVTILLVGSGTAMAAHKDGDEGHHHHDPVPGSAAQAVGDPAFQVYDAVVAECARKIMPIPKNKEEAKSSAMKKALDREKIKDLEACMESKGVKADFENYHKKANKGKTGEGMLDPEMIEDIDEIRKVMDSGEAPVQAAPSPSYTYDPAAGKPTVIQPDILTVPPAAQEDAEEDDVSKPAVKGRLWVTP